MVDVIQHNKTKAVYMVATGDTLPSENWKRIKVSIPESEARIYIEEHKNKKQKC